MKRNRKKSTRRVHRETMRGDHLKRSDMRCLRLKKPSSYISKIIKLLLVVALLLIIYDTIHMKNTGTEEINNKLDTMLNELETLQNKQIELEEKQKVLETAKLEKKAQEEQAQKEAEEKAKQESVKIAVTSRGGVTSRTTTTVSTGTKAEYQAYAKDLCLNTYSWSEYDFECLVKLWNKESGWNPNAHNKSSGAHGIPQSLPASKMSSEGADYYTNGKTQIRWGLKYIKNRYGTPAKAWQHSQQKNWY